MLAGFFVSRHETGLASKFMRGLASNWRLSLSIQKSQLLHEEREGEFVADATALEIEIKQGEEREA